MDSPDPSSGARSRRLPFVQRVCIGTLFGLAAQAAVWLGTSDESLFEGHRLAQVGGIAALAGVLVAAIPFRRRWVALAVYVPTLAAVISVASVIQAVREAPPFHASDFECDGPPGHVSSARLGGWDDERDVHVLTGRIVPSEPRHDVEWPPTAGLVLVPSEGKSTYGLKLSNPQSGPEYALEALYRDRSGERAVEDLDVRSPLAQPLPFELRWAGRQALLLVGDGVWLGRREIDFRPEKVRMFCSTGRARFEELWRDRLALADPAELGPVSMASFRTSICAQSDELLLNLILIQKGAEPEIAGVSITNCEPKPLRLVERSTRFTLQERDGETWRAKRDLTPYLCCNTHLGILDPDEDFSLSGLPSGLDAIHRLRFELEVGGRTLHSEEFGPGNQR